MAVAVAGVANTESAGWTGTPGEGRGSASLIRPWSLALLRSRVTALFRSVKFKAVPSFPPPKINAWEGIRNLESLFPDPSPVFSTW